jgi:cell division protein FtsB
MNPDPISAALDALHNQNLLAAENARLKAEVERLRDGVETMTYHAPGVETTAWVRAVEYDRLKAEVAALRKELADAQESYHLCNERIASLLRKQSRE